MTTAQPTPGTPARIWLNPYYRQKSSVVQGQPERGHVEYIRADIADDLLAALRDALPELEFMESFIGAPNAQTAVARQANAEISALVERVRAVLHKVEQGEG